MKIRKPQAPVDTTLQLATTVRGSVVKVLSVEEIAVPEGTVTSSQFRPHTLLVMEFGALLLDREGRVLGALPFTAKELLGEKERITELEDLRDELLASVGIVDRAISLHKNRAVEWIGKLQARVEAKCGDADDPDAQRLAASARRFLRLQEKAVGAATSKRRATLDRNAEIAELRQDLALRDLRIKAQGGDQITVEDVAQLSAARQKARQRARTTARKGRR